MITPVAALIVLQTAPRHKPETPRGVHTGMPRVRGSIEGGHSTVMLPVNQAARKGGVWLLTSSPSQTGWGCCPPGTHADHVRGRGRPIGVAAWLTSCGVSHSRLRSGASCLHGKHYSVDLFALAVEDTQTMKARLTRHSPSVSKRPARQCL